MAHSSGRFYLSADSASVAKTTSVKEAVLTKEENFKMGRRQKAKRLFFISVLF